MLKDVWYRWMIHVLAQEVLGLLANPESRARFGAAARKRALLINA